MSALVILLLIVVTAAGLWVSSGHLAVATPDPGASRIGLLPPWWVLGLAVVAAATAIVTLARRRRPVAPLALIGLTLLPWVPLVEWPAWLLWSGPIVWFVWAGAVIALAAAVGWFRELAPARVVRLARDPRRAPAAAAVAAAGVFGLAAWGAAPAVPGGEEPHYLIITQSLLQDFDLAIENNHRQRDFRAYLDFAELKPDYLVRSTTGEIYSIHVPGVSVLVLPAFAVAGYPGVKAFLILLSALGTALAWRIGWRLTGDAGAAWFGWASASLGTTFVFHTFTVYPDGVGGLATLVGIWLIVRLDRDAWMPGPGSFLAAGVALAFLPWLHPRFALIAGTLGAAIALASTAHWGWQRAIRPLAAFAVVPVASAIGWFAYFYLIYGTPHPAAPYGGVGAMGSRWSYVSEGLAGLLFDQQFGLLMYSPVLVAAFVGFAPLLRHHARWTGVAIAAIVLAYPPSVTHYRMWWAGASAPARFFVPVVLTLSIPAALVWARSRGTATRALLVALLTMTATTTGSLAMVQGGRLAFNVRDGHALWLEWLSPLADLTLALPSFHRGAPWQAFWQATIWIGALVAVWIVTRRLDRRASGRRGLLELTVPLALAVAGMAAAAIVWRLNGAVPVRSTFAQLRLLRAVPPASGPAVLFRPFERLTPVEAASRLTIDTAPRYLSSRDRPLFVLPELPAGYYRLHVETDEAAGRLRIGIAREDFVIREIALADVVDGGEARVDILFPVDVRALVVRGDEAAHAAVRRLTLEPFRVLEAAHVPVRGRAQRAVGYPGGVVYFLDDGAVAEPSAFWVRGSGQSWVAITPAVPEAGAAGRELEIFVRNAPVPNRLTLEVGRWRSEIDLNPGEERRVLLPVDPRQPAIALHLSSSAGFRPSEVEPGSLDERFLGVWVEVRSEK